MKIKEIFSKYIDITEKNIATEYMLDIEMLYDDKNQIMQKPDELVSIYRSDNGDELFIILDAREKNIMELCKIWDDKISCFVNFGSRNREVIRRFKYNIVLIILCTNGEYNKYKKVEVSKNVSRKILLPYEKDMDLDKRTALKIPFYYEPIDGNNDDYPCEPFDDNQSENNDDEYLNTILPSDDVECLYVLKENKRRNNNNGIWEKLFDNTEFESIKGWLLNEN